ncbi:MAG: hypothetical protein OQK78_03895 [Gammaproteobacteria bacterium]|nr:hypothetical protein [Gammaproteobacteria bacterium]MCW8887959.1 hypothetical protein [Gammaproteobacteria bacterium]MCW8983150.1 hypothetical protein [Gammaproteobacteria bacterium]
MRFEIEHYPQGYQILKDGFDARDEEVLRVLNSHEYLISVIRGLYAGYSPSTEEEADFDSEVYELLYGDSK